MLYRSYNHLFSFILVSLLSFFPLNMLLCTCLMSLVINAQPLASTLGGSGFGQQCSIQPPKVKCSLCNTFLVHVEGLWRCLFWPVSLFPPRLDRSRFRSMSVGRVTPSSEVSEEFAPCLLHRRWITLSSLLPHLLNMPGLIFLRVPCTLLTSQFFWSVEKLKNRVDKTEAPCRLFHFFFFCLVYLTFILLTWNNTTRINIT